MSAQQFIKVLEELSAKATPGPWWRWPDMPYLFSGNREQKNAYMASDTVRVARIDYTDNDADLIEFLANNRQQIIDLVKAAERHCVKRMLDDDHELRQALASFKVNP